MTDQEINKALALAIVERDAALARLAELRFQKPCASISRCALNGAEDCTCGVNGPCENLTDVYAAAGASTQPSESANHWHSLYLKKCQELHDEKARLGAEIETLELAAIDDAERYTSPPSKALQSCSCRWDADDNRIATCTRHQGWLDVVGEWADRAKVAESKLAQPADNASAYAKAIAVYLWKKFYKKSAPTFEACDELYDVLSQIDNMVAGLPAQPTHTPRVGDLRTDVVNPMAAWPFETEASVEARQRAAFEAKGV